jgi:hypothetical protein
MDVVDVVDFVDFSGRSTTSTKYRLPGIRCPLSMRGIARALPSSAFGTFSPPGGEKAT